MLSFRKVSGIKGSSFRFSPEFYICYMADILIQSLFWESKLLPKLIFILCKDLCVNTQKTFTVHNLIGLL